MKKILAMLLSLILLVLGWFLNFVVADVIGSDSLSVVDNNSKSLTTFSKSSMFH